MSQSAPLAYSRFDFRRSSRRSVKARAPRTRVRTIQFSRTERSSLRTQGRQPYFTRPALSSNFCLPSVVGSDPTGGHQRRHTHPHRARSRCHTPSTRRHATGDLSGARPVRLTSNRPPSSARPGCEVIGQSDRPPSSRGAPRRGEALSRTGPRAGQEKKSRRGHRVLESAEPRGANSSAAGSSVYQWAPGSRMSVSSAPERSRTR